jgi:zinc D-Ala-D-Ala carboxypeptidase
MTTPFYRDWCDVPKNAWRWPNFSPAEIACRGTGKLLINEPALDRLQALRDRLGKPLIVRSAYRSPEHNRAVGGAGRLKQLDGTAFDIAMANHDPAAFEASARAVGFFGFGFYPRSGFMHIDLGSARVWERSSRCGWRRLLWRRCRCGRCWLRAGRCVGQGRRAWPPWVRPA